MLLECYGPRQTSTGALVGGWARGPLHESVRLGRIQAAALLLERGCPTEPPTAGGQSPLLAACADKQLEAVKLLLSHGASVRYQNPLTGMTAIIEACARLHMPMLSLLLQQKGIDISFCDKEGNTALHYACRSAKSVEMASLLLETSSGWPSPEAKGKVADDCLLLWNRFRATRELLRTLVAHGLRGVAATNAKGQTALHIACWERQLEAVLVLLDLGANPEKTDREGSDCIQTLLKTLEVYRPSEPEMEVLETVLRRMLAATSARATKVAALQVSPLL